MNKFLLFLIIVSIFTVSLYSKESNLAILRVIHSNGLQQFSMAQEQFFCKTYGVLTLNELYKKSKNDSQCQKKIKQFYINNPNSISFTKRLLKQRQQYKIEFRKDRCIIYASGQVSISEILLKNGLAVLRPKFEDEEYIKLFTSAQSYAQKEKIGLFKNKIMAKCISELYKID